MRAALCAGLARAAGLAGMVGGQMLDIEAETAAAPLSLEEIARLQAMKTGALLSFSVEAGALLAGASAARGAALEAYGRAIGAAFQIADDLLDAEGDTATLGQARRQGRRPPQGDARLRARHRKARGRARPTGRRSAKRRSTAAGVGEAGDGLRAAAEFVAPRKS